MEKIKQKYTKNEVNDLFFFLHKFLGAGGDLFMDICHASLDGTPTGTNTNMLRVAASTYRSYAGCFSCQYIG